MAAWKTLPAADQYIPARRVVTLAKRRRRGRSGLRSSTPSATQARLPCARHGRVVPADKRINENLAGRTNTGG
jgi:hypothetical protein